MNFAPRVTVPVLMLNGRYDYFYPTALSQEPLFALLGTLPAHKRRVVYETSHAIPRNDTVKEVVRLDGEIMGRASALMSDPRLWPAANVQRHNDCRTANPSVRESVHVFGCPNAGQ